MATDPLAPRDRSHGITDHTAHTGIFPKRMQGGQKWACYLNINTFDQRITLMAFVRSNPPSFGASASTSIDALNRQVMVSSIFIGHLRSHTGDIEPQPSLFLHRVPMRSNQTCLVARPVFDPVE